MTSFWLLCLPVLLAFASAPPCGADAFEPNDRPQRARRHGARPLAAAVCPGDEDWFQVRLPAGVGVEVSIRHAAGAHVEPPDVFTPGRRRRAIGRAFRVEGEVGRRFVTRRAGPYRVRIRGGEPGGTAYRLRFWTEDP
jgi:hypothetical protein